MTLKFCISVPIGSYHPLLEQCLSSLVAQIENAKDYELAIAFLDASGDPRVKAVADQFDSFLTYRRHGPDKGQSDAILEGWEAIDSDILGWLNADDILFPGALAQAASRLSANAEVNLVYGHSTILDDNFRTQGYHWAVELPGPRILEAGTISQPSCFFRREAYDRAGGLNRDLHYTMDWDLWIRMYKSGAKFEFIDQTMSMVLWADETKTSSFNKLRQQEIENILKANLDEPTQRKVFRSFAIHHYLDKLRPAFLQRLVTRALIRGRNCINGISGDGQMQNHAEIIMAHYTSQPKKAILIEIENPTGIIEISSPDQKIASWSRSGRTFEVVFEHTVRAGNSVTMAFKVDPQKPAFFHWSAWQ